MQLDLEVQPAVRVKTGVGWRARLRTLALYALAIGVAVLVVSRTPRDFSLTLEQVRPVAHIVAVVLSIAALVGLALAVQSIRRHGQQFNWRVSARLAGWGGLAGSAAGVVILAMQKSPDGFMVGGAARAVELVVPLALAVQAALLFSPDDEPALEVQLACPRPAAWLALERLALLGVMQAGVAVAGVLICRLIDPALAVPHTLLNWMPPALLLSGIGLYVTLRSRVAAFGAVITGAAWFVFALFGAAFLPGAPTFWPMTLLQPFIWMVNPYLQPGDVPTGDFWLNRLIVLALGVVAFMAAAWHMSSEERLLLNSRKGK